jgi:hypothetical protein
MQQKALFPCPSCVTHYLAVFLLVTVAQGLRAKNVEIETAVEDLIATLKQHPVDPSIPPVSEAECDKVRMQYNKLMYSVRGVWGHNAPICFVGRVAYTERPGECGYFVVCVWVWVCVGVGVGVGMPPVACPVPGYQCPELLAGHQESGVPTHRVRLLVHQPALLRGGRPAVGAFGHPVSLSHRHSAHREPHRSCSVAQLQDSLGVGPTGCT